MRNAIGLWAPIRRYMAPRLRLALLLLRDMVAQFMGCGLIM
jgi:hypothetical protein